MPKECKNLVMSVAFTNPADLLDLFTRISSRVMAGGNCEEIKRNSAKAVWHVEYATNYQYEDRVINGKHVRTYKSKL
tara:strand:+ start:5696 stop:5926 length:231 start_codon:yes stop_codon:yes gene_type:complete